MAVELRLCFFYASKRARGLRYTVATVLGLVGGVRPGRELVYVYINPNLDLRYGLLS